MVGREHRIVKIEDLEMFVQDVSSSAIGVEHRAKVCLDPNRVRTVQYLQGILVKNDALDKARKERLTAILMRLPEPEV
jgi:hypothetical protein